MVTLKKELVLNRDAHSSRYREFYRYICFYVFKSSCSFSLKFYCSVHVFAQCGVLGMPPNCLGSTLDKDGGRNVLAFQEVIESEEQLVNWMA